MVEAPSFTQFAETRRARLGGLPWCHDADRTYEDASRPGGRRGPVARDRDEEARARRRSGTRNAPAGELAGITSTPSRRDSLARGERSSGSRGCLAIVIRSSNSRGRSFPTSPRRYSEGFSRRDRDKIRLSTLNRVRQAVHCCQLSAGVIVV